MNLVRWGKLEITEEMLLYHFNLTNSFAITWVV